MLDRTLRRPPDSGVPPVSRPTLACGGISSALDALEQGRAAAAILIVEPVVWRAYCLGYSNALSPTAEVIADLRERIEAVERDRDELYERLHNPGRQLVAIRARRLAEALDTAFWRGELRTLENEVTVAVAACAAPPRPEA